LKIQLSRDELASIIGTATESCIRLLSDFKKLGLIELTGKKIILKDINALKN
jgi:CRP-like cAMP-binding protein